MFKCVDDEDKTMQLAIASTASGGSRMKHRNLIAIGKTGTGKSSTCNTLLQTDVFKTDPGGLPTTQSCQQLRKTLWGRALSIIDTPGTMDVVDPKRAMKELEKAMDFCPGGVDAFLLTFRCDVRATEEELQAASDALNMFGPECYKRAIVVFTHSEVYKNDATKYKEQLVRMRGAIPTFNKLMTQLKNRWVMLDNREECSQQVREEQVMGLLRLVDQVAHYNPRRYATSDQQAAIKKREELQAMESQLDKTVETMMQMQAQAQDRIQQQNVMMQHMAFQLQSREAGYQAAIARVENRERQFIVLMQRQAESMEQSKKQSIMSRFCLIQ